MDKPFIIQDVTSPIVLDNTPHSFFYAHKGKYARANSQKQASKSALAI
jgi:hypothetical protein